jgi:predicted ATP-dependent protease
MPIEPLSPRSLRQVCRPEEIPFQTTAEVGGEVEIIGQARASEAVRFGAAIEHEGYNLMALGPEGIGKQTLLGQVLKRLARQAATPEDWCYVMNHQAPNRPRALSLPPGRGSQLKLDLERAVASLHRSMPVAFASQEYRTRRQRLDRQLEERQDAILEPVRQQALGLGIDVSRSESGVVLSPLDELTEEQHEALQSNMERVEAEVETLFASFHLIEREHQESLELLHTETAAPVARQAVDELRCAYAELPEVLAYLDSVEQDVVKNFPAEPEEGDEGIDESRFQVNVVIDQHGRTGAPLIYEDHPTCSNLVGHVEQISQLGTLVTDFTLIRPGALHRARGGYLLLDAARVLDHPSAWKALKRALRTGKIRPRTSNPSGGPRLEPEPIPLGHTKVVLLGDRSLYELLAGVDPDVTELFKVVVEFEECLDRPGATETYARLLASLVAKLGLRPFHQTALARLIEEASRRSEDAEKLTLQMRAMADLLIESDYWATGEVVTDRDVEQALSAQRRRVGRTSEKILEQIMRRSVAIATEGEEVGQVNGLSVLQVGQQWFGFPSRISARVWPGREELVDIEREVELGGPFHSKGVLILKAFLGAHYATESPLALSASLAFEQTYSLVEGDSASLAELCALLSALADTPLRQGLAVTGAINQHGQVQAIGAVNEKVEGFFELCKQRGLTGQQGVILPVTNLQNLMLSPEVVQAVEAGRFAVYAVEHVDQALELLTGCRAGQRDGSGHFARGSLNERVQSRLTALSALSWHDDRDHRVLTRGRLS